MEFFVLSKKEGQCPFCDAALKSIRDKNYTHTVLYKNKDFLDKEFKDLFGETATYPRVYIVKPGGKKVLLGDSEKTIEFISKQNAKKEKK